MRTTIITLEDFLQEYWAYVALYVASASILSAVALNFLAYRRQAPSVLRTGRHFVDTFSMTVFFFAVFYLGERGLGTVTLPPTSAFACELVGALLALIGAGLNLAGRRALGRFWSNQIEIQREHHVVTDGPYRWMRHPLYGSLIVFGVGMALVMQNVMVLVAVVCLFAPAMAHRAKSEEKLLSVMLGETYRQYQMQCPMLMPALEVTSAIPISILLLALQLTARWRGEPALIGLSALLALACAPLMKRAKDRRLYLGAALLGAVCAPMAKYSEFWQSLPAFGSMALLAWQIARLAADRRGHDGRAR